MPEPGIAEHPTTITTVARTSKEPSRSLNMEIKTVMPLEGTAGAALSRISDEIAKNRKEQTDAIQARDMDRLITLYGAEDDYGLELQLLQQATRLKVQELKSLGQEITDNPFKGDYRYYNLASVTDIQRILDTQVIGGPDGFQEALAKNPQAMVDQWSGIKVEKMLVIAQALKERLSKMPQAPKTPAR